MVVKKFAVRGGPAYQARSPPGRTVSPKGGVVAPMTPEERSLRARLGAHALHAKHDSHAISTPGRKAFLERFVREVDPGGVLPEAERTRRADHARKAYMLSLALRSAQARRKGGSG